MIEMMIKLRKVLNLIYHADMLCNPLIVLVKGMNIEYHDVYLNLFQG